MTDTVKSKRGFASMDPEKQREIASKGGRAAHAKGTAHKFDSNEGREAGRRGGKAIAKRPGHMAEIGRKGGEARRVKPTDPLVEVPDPAPATKPESPAEPEPGAAPEF